MRSSDVEPQTRLAARASHLDMFSTDDTIVAIATPPGRGGIGVVRLSGPEAAAIARDADRTRRLRAASRDADDASPDRDGRAIDQAVVTHFPAPHSYTGDEVVELSAHGSPVVLDAIVRAALAPGAQAGEPGGVHVPRVSPRTDRSGAGRGRRRADRRGDAAAGAGGVRSARRHADGAAARDGPGAARSDRAARSVARFSGRGLSLHHAGRHGARAGRDRARRSRRCWRTRRAAG